MEHILQVGISVDDEAVRKSVEKQLLNALVEDIKKDIYESLPTKRISFSNDNKQVDWLRFTHGIVEQMMEDEDVKRAIISEAAERLAEKVSRTKAWREKYYDVAELS